MRAPPLALLRAQSFVTVSEPDPPPAPVGVFQEGPPRQPCPGHLHVTAEPLSLAWDVAPRCGPSLELAVRSIEGLPGMEEIEEREAGRAPATDASPAIAFRVVARVTFALGLDPLGDLQLVG